MGNKGLRLLSMLKIKMAFECMCMSEAELNQKTTDTMLYTGSKRGLTWRINDAYVKGGRTSVFM